MTGTTYNPELDSLEFKVEASLVKFLLTAGLPLSQLFTGENTEPVTLPAVICCCHGGPEEPPGSNSYLQDVTVCIRSNLDLTNTNADPGPVHRRLVKQVRDALWNNRVDAAGVEWLHSYLSCQVPNFTVMREIQFDGKFENIRDRKIDTEFRFKMACCEMPGLPDAQLDYADGRLILGSVLPEDIALLAILTA